MTMCAQIEFAWSKRVAKPTMQEHDCAVRLTFFLDMDDRWHLKVHGLIDQGEFRVPLNHTVRGGFREPEHSTCTCILHTLFRAFWGMCLRVFSLLGSCSGEAAKRGRRQRTHFEGVDRSPTVFQSYLRRP